MKSRATPEAREPETTDDAILGGRLRLLQPKRGHRVGHDAVLLAAATDARPGDHVVDFGAGVGAAGLALLARVPRVTVTLAEIDPGLTALATENIARNGYVGSARTVALDVTAGDEAFAAAGLPPACADNVMMNPPFNDPAQQQLSPDPHRRSAHVAAPGSLMRWIRAASRLLRPTGTLTMIWRADALDDLLSTLTPHFGGIFVLPVHGRAGQPAIRVLVAAAKVGRGSQTVLPPLILNDAAGRPTEAAERVLRNAEGLHLGVAA
jgi:tRNA1(Val) A37 N6-methylase TrmN6